MFQSPSPDAIASTVPAATAPNTLPSPESPPPTAAAESEVVRHMLFGSLNAVQSTMIRLYQLNYAEPHEWSRPMPTERPNEVMVVLTKKVHLRKP